MEIVDLLHPDEPSFERDYHRLAASESLLEAAIGKKMLEFLDALRNGIVGPRLSASRWEIHHSELHLSYSDGCGHSTLITVFVDWKDRSQLVNGIPLLHYRLSYTRDDLPAVEYRTRNVHSAYEFVEEAIKQCKT